MANLKEQEKWEDGVYQIEENDPVLGGENGITNKPAKQLANRTLWLKKFLELLGKKSVPKDLTAESTSTADETGHSHKLPIGSTTQKGIWQATSDTGVDSDGLVLTAKAGKKLAQLIATVQLALNNYIPNRKKSSRVDSNSADDVATSAAVKAANDNANSRVPKVGDTEIAGRHFFKNDNSWIGVISTDSATAGYDTTVKDGKFPQVTYGAAEVGNHGVEARIFVTSEGPSYEIDRRRHVLTVGITGQMWSAAYGQLHDYFHHDNKSYVVVKQDGGLAGLHINRQNGKRARVELIDDKRWKFWLEDKYDIFMPEKGGTVALLDDVDLAKQAADAANQAALNAHQEAINANDNANNRVSRAGDVMTGDLTVPHLFVVRPHSWLDVKSTESNGAGLDMTVSNAGAAQAAVEAVDVGNHTVEMRFHVMPPGYDFDIKRRQVGMTLSGHGHIWAKPYGWLHDYFHHGSKSYVNVTQEGGRAGLNIDRRNAKRARVELIDDKFWKFWLEDKYDIFMPERGGTVALNDDFVGMVAYFATPTAPTGFLKCNGAAVSRATYAALFARIGTTFGAGDGRTTFNLPDLRGEFLRCLDDGRNIDGGRRLGTAQSDAIKTHTINVPDSGSAGNNMGMWFYGERGGPNDNGHNTITYNGESETRPRNVALLACIKY